MKHHHYKTIFFALLAVGVVAAVGWHLYGASRELVAQAPSQPVSAMPAPAVAPALASYTNAAYGFLSRIQKNMRLLTQHQTRRSQNWCA
jgi:hypothetical protein